MHLKKREQFRSRLGVILAIASSAVGLGNVWRFPYIAGSNGGALFIVLYILCLLFIGLPILMTELSIGRGAHKSLGHAMDDLQPAGSKWHYFKYFIVLGAILICGYYPVIIGWVIYYFVGLFDGFLLDPSKTSKEVFSDFVTNKPADALLCTYVAIFFCAACSWLGIKKGIERTTKPMMILLLLFLVLLCGYAISLPNAEKGLEKFFVPDLTDLSLSKIGSILHAALGQVFFTLGCGVGIIMAYASYMGKKKTIVSESLIVCGIDTFVAILAGIMIFAACYSQGIGVDAGVSLVFQSMVEIFKHMPMGQFFGVSFFFLLFIAAITSLISVFESVVSFGIDCFNLSRKKSVFYVSVINVLITIPAVYSFSTLANVELFGQDIITFEDFVSSNIFMVLGSLLFAVFCYSRYGWGINNYMAEINEGHGVKLPNFFRNYLRFVIPIFILIVFVTGIMS